MYLWPCEVFKGLKVSVATPGDAVKVMPFPSIKASPLEFSHTEVGMAARPEMTLCMIQIRVNSDPATWLPEILTVAEMGTEGTAGKMV